MTEEKCSHNRTFKVQIVWKISVFRGYRSKYKNAEN